MRTKESGCAGRSRISADAGREGFTIEDHIGRTPSIESHRASEMDAVHWGQGGDHVAKNARSRTRFLTPRQVSRPAIDPTSPDSSSFSSVVKNRKAKREVIAPSRRTLR